ncbi:hypothetical protein A3F01_06180 [Candidatus Woesebacteria bacterium RIFCSPHIGHO2_12_FULL_38_11]|nr:MAG: hypothetical protein A3F01_06180 [Candidatus Woesebacteria bacterium RIFCSPHIGHO2_12_FULL_38_11]
MDDVSRWDLIHQKAHKEDEWHSVYAEEKEKLFPRNAMIIELGSGTGVDAIYFLKQGHSVIALDISTFALNALETRVKKENLAQKLTTQQVDFGLHDLPIKEGSVDVAYSRISLNYFGAKHTTKLFSDIYRMLKPGGAAYLSFRSPEDANEMEYFEKSSVLYEPNVFIEGEILRSRFTATQLEQMLINAGIPQFSVEAYQEDLSAKGENHHPILYVNDIYFMKQ